MLSNPFRYRTEFYEIGVTKSRAMDGKQVAQNGRVAAII
jgi:hypothetical protein